MNKILIIMGTRPEAIKLAPVIRELEKNKKQLITRVCITAQHRQMLDQVLSVFKIKADFDLDLMHQNQSLSLLTSRMLTALDELISREKPDLIIVQGDTTTAMAAAIGAFYNKIKIAHVEAGLRTYNRYSPYPEEINRRVIDLMADFYFTPTKTNRQNLIGEGVDPSKIFITGNTVIDALLQTRKFVMNHPPDIAADINNYADGKRLILVTAHRRESFGKDMENICHAVREITESNPDILTIYPVHLNPNVREKTHKILKDNDRIKLINPMSYTEFVWLMDRSEIILTDSGGVQEEAPSLGKPVLVMRNHTERPEGIRAGNAVLVGTDTEKIINTVSRLLNNPEKLLKMTRKQNPYGDGKAASRISEILMSRLSCSD